MFVYIRSAAFVIVTQKLVLQQSQKRHSKVYGNPTAPSFYSISPWLFQRCTHLVYCSVLSLGGKVNRRRMSQPDMGSIFHIKKQWNILVIGNYYVNYQNYQICFHHPRILNEHWCIYSCLQTPPRENWFQSVRREYAEQNKILKNARFS